MIVSEKSGREIILGVRLLTCRVITVLFLVLLVFTMIPFVAPEASNANSAAKLQWPTPGYEGITEGRYFSSDHAGIDISKDKTGKNGTIKSTPIYAAQAGKVIEISKCSHNTFDWKNPFPSCCSGGGTRLVIRGTDGYTYEYAHMQANSIPSRIKKGTDIKKGFFIGKVGNTGNSSGTHLHFGVFKGDKINWEKIGGKWKATNGVNPLSFEYTYSKPCKSHKWDTKTGLCQNCGVEYRFDDSDSVNLSDKTVFFTKFHRIGIDVNDAYVRIYPAAGADKVKKDAIAAGRYIYVYGSETVSGTKWFKIKYGVGTNTIGYLQSSKIANYSPNADYSKIAISDCGNMDLKKGSARKLNGKVTSNYPIRDIRIWIDKTDIKKDAVKAKFASSDIKKSYTFSTETDLNQKLEKTFKSLGAGTHPYKLIARDITGKTATVEAAFYVNNDVNMPLIKFTPVVGGYKVTFTNRTTNAEGELWEKLGNSREFEKKNSGYSQNLTTVGTRTISAYTVLNGKKSGVAKKVLTINQLATPNFTINQKKDGTATVKISAVKGASISYKLGDDGNYITGQSNPVTVSVSGGQKLIAYAEGKGYVRSEVQEFTSELVEPDVPTVRAPSLINNTIGIRNPVVLIWNKDPKAVSYTVNMYNDKDKLINSSETQKNCETISISAPGDYYFTVYASNEMGKSDESEPVNVKAVSPFTVTFRDAGTTTGDTETIGAILNQQTVEYGKTPTSVTAPTKEGYVFQGWDDGNSTSTNAYLKTTVKKDITYTAVYVKKEYNVKLIDTTGDSLGSVNVSHGDSLLDAISEAGITPTISSGSKLIGWQVTKTADGESKADIEHIDSDMEVHAVAAWENPDLPVVIDSVTADQTSDGNYVNVKVDITANNTEDLSFYMVVALKSEDKTTGAEKTVYADRKIIYLSEEDGSNAAVKQMSFKLPMKSGASKAEVSALECGSDMNTGGLYAKSKSTVINLSYDWDDDSWSEYSTEKPEESETRQVESKVTYEYREKETVYSSAENLSGYTKIGAEYYNFSTGKWQTSPYTQIGDYAVSEPKKTVNTYEEYTDTLSYNSIVSYWSYAYLCSHMDWYTSKSGAACPSGSKAYTMLKVYSSKSLAASGYTKNSDNSYTLPKTISTASPGNLGTIYRIDTYNSSTGEEQARVNTFTTKTSDNHIKLWDKGTRTLYRATVVRMRNKFEKWGEWKDAPENITASDTVAVRAKETLYRYRDAIPASASAVDVDPEGKITRHFTGTITDSNNNEIEMDLEGKSASVMVYRSNNTDPNKYQLEYLGNTVIGAGNTYDITFIPKEEPTLDTGNFIVALSIEGMSGIINIAAVEVDDESIPSYNVIFGYEERDENGVPVFKEIEGSTQLVKRHSDADLSLVDAPKREGYYFVGWEGRTTNLVNDVKVIAKYIAIPNPVAIVDWMRHDIDMFTANTGDVIELPGAPDETNGHTFIGWRTPEGDLLEAGSEYTITGTTVIEAEYTQQEYTVTFIGVDGSTVDTQTVKYGNAAEPPAYTWSDENGEFVGWSQENSWWNVDSNMEVKPVVAYTSYAPDPSAVNVIDEESGERQMILQVEDEEDFSDLKIYYATEQTSLTEEEIAKAQNGDSTNVAEYTEPLVFEQSCEIFVVTYAKNANLSNIVSLSYTPYTEDESDDTVVEGWTTIDSLDVKAKAGAEVTVTVNLDENPGLNGYSLIIQADKDIFVPDLNDYDEPVVDNGVTAECGTHYTGETDNGWTVAWVSEDTMTQTGKLMSMKFHVSSDTEEGIYPITVFYEAEGTLDEMNEPVDLESARVTAESTACIGLDTLDVKLARYSYAFEGEPIEPSVRITDLKENEDYTVRYEDNVNVGTAKAIVSGIGDYAGTVEVEFEITQANIANADITAIEDVIKTGEAIEPALNVSYNTYALELGRDYEVAFDNNTEVGEATITLTGIGNFKGATETKFQIIETVESRLAEAERMLAEAQAALEDASSAIEDLTAAQQQLEEDKAAIEAELEEANSNLEAAIAERDAALADAETSAETIAALEQQVIDATNARDQAQSDLDTLQSSYDDLQSQLQQVQSEKEEAERRAESAEKELQRIQNDLSMATITGLKGKVYNGKEQTQELIVELHGKALKQDKDYTVNYVNNVKVGTATVTIAAAEGSEYYGSVAKNFSITKAANPLTVKAKTATVSKGKVKKKAQKLAASKVVSISKAQGKITYAKVSGSNKLSITKAGQVTVKKKTKKGTFKMKVKVTAAGNATYKAGSKTVTITVKVK